MNEAWIPVTERLPKNMDLVLTCSIFGEIDMEYYNRVKKGFTSKLIPKDSDISYRIVAWMPLPNPYKLD
ncbi:MAG TPA: DUF551 domain-containing protein [Clostridiales bacterium]|nr:DUF551 domain-containing protein [Clostridiales bacterium]